MMRGTSLFARALRGSAWVIFGFGAAQVIRLASNLILTRILFPEAFGLMALVTVFTVGLTMFSDVGIGPSIARSPRGDDPDYLNTAWTIQVFRGLGLWIVAIVLAWPVAIFYGEPQLALLLPIAGSALFIGGFDPTRIETANRHLLMGRITVLELGSQVVGVVAMTLLALWLQSVMALVIGNLISVAVRLVAANLYLPGERNRFRWEREAARDLITYGKWIFLSTVFGFFSLQGDRAILGKYFSLAMLGIYNIGYFLASFPMLLGHNITGRLLIPIYREKPPGASAENFAKLRRMRFALTTGLMALVLLMAFVGQPLIDFLYDARYRDAGAIVVLLACFQIPVIIGMSYDQAALAAGDSRGFFVLSVAKASLKMGLLLVGASGWGLIGALFGLILASLLTYPVNIWLAVRSRAWDPLHDAVFAVIGGAGGALAVWLNWGAITALG